MVTFGAGFLIARIQGNQALTAANKQCEQKLNEQRQKLGQEAQALERARFRATLLGSYRQIYLGVLSLEDRNFGTAKKHTQKAGTALKSLAEKEGTSKQNTAALNKIGQELATWQPDVTQDVGNQRKHLLSLSEKLRPVLQASR